MSWPFSLQRGGRDASGTEAEPEAESPWLPSLAALPLPLAALLALLVYAWGDWDVLAVAALVAAGAFVGGGLFGFLFGIPRSLAQPVEDPKDTSAGRYQPNTNLEQISDWLTKILVGVGLVQFTTLAGHAGDLVSFLGPSFGGDPYGETFAGGTLVVFGVSGFLAFYLVTRMYLPRAFAHADQRARDLEGYERVKHQRAVNELKSANADDPEIEAAVSRVSAVVEKRPPQILWVDDNPRNNVRERNAMTTLGMHVVISLSTDEALELLSRTRFDVVISDMGRQDDKTAGYTLLDAMRSRGDPTPFVIYAGSDAAEHREEARKRGALGSTNRPSELLDLVLQATQLQG